MKVTLPDGMVVEGTPDEIRAFLDAPDVPYVPYNPYVPSVPFEVTCATPTNVINVYANGGAVPYQYVEDAGTSAIGFVVPSEEDDE